jgi:hypothetical protein
MEEECRRRRNKGGGGKEFGGEIREGGEGFWGEL